MARFRVTRQMYRSDSTAPFMAERIIEAKDKDSVEVIPDDKVESARDDEPLCDWRVVHE